MQIFIVLAPGKVQSQYDWTAPILTRTNNPTALGEWSRNEQIRRRKRKLCQATAGMAEQIRPAHAPVEEGRVQNEKLRHAVARMADVPDVAPRATRGI